MKTIWKIVLRDTAITASVPAGARVLCVQAQNDKPVLWLQLDDESPAEDRQFVLYMTGEAIPESRTRSLHYIGTVQLHTGTYVLHVFENVKKATAQ